MTEQVLTSFYFTLSITGYAVDAAFQEITGLSKELHVEEVVCGGENRFKYRLPTTPSYQNLVLKRGVTLADSPLLKWCMDTIDSGLTKSVVPRDVIVNLLDEQGKACKTWTFVKAYPVKWSASELSSEKNAVLIETIELAFLYFLNT